MAFQSTMEKTKFRAIDEMSWEKKGFKVGAVLYNGSFSCVCKATYKDTPVVVKVTDWVSASADYRFAYWTSEIWTMKVLKHKYLIETLDIFVVVDNRVLVFMELADGGDFVDMLHETKALSEGQARYFYRQFGDALRYLHSVGTAHQDIRCENILLNKARTVSKLTGFDLTRKVILRDTGNIQLSFFKCGSADYMAPEVKVTTWNREYNSMISDVWSTGVVLFVLTQDRFPFTDCHITNQLACQRERKYKFVKTVSNQCKELISMHLDPDVTKRATMEQVFAHEWFDVDKPQED